MNRKTLPAALSEADRIRQDLQDWFSKNKRALPWRQTEDWYAVFLSEFLLQQTRVEQALPFYTKFIKRFPDIHALAEADEQEILRLWNGLGYYSRARNLLKAAGILVKDFEAEFPRNYHQALRLPGIGPYTASAILSIAFGQALPVVDGNVVRVLTRYFAISADVRKSATQKLIYKKACLLLNPDAPGLHNETLMEVGALICKPKNPACRACPLFDGCRARQQGIVETLPKKSPAKKKKIIRQYTLIIQSDNQYLIRQRPAKGLLASLWEFPFLEVSSLNHSAARLHKLLEKEIEGQATATRIFEAMKHEYSHISLHYKPLLILISKKSLIKNMQGKWLTGEELNDFPIHAAHRKIIQSQNGLLFNK